jgi:GNAT superfamily N-acetyltransferase
MSLTHRPVAEEDIQIICGFPQSEDELFFLFPKATFPLATSQLQDVIAQRSDATVVELDGEIVAFANFYRWEAGGCCSIGNVIVSPAVRGRGVGRYLIEQMIGVAFSIIYPDGCEIKLLCKPILCLSASFIFRYGFLSRSSLRSCRHGEQGCRPN